jgi:hypothetical protein
MTNHTIMHVEILWKPPEHIDNHGDAPEDGHGDSHIDTGFSHTDNT